MNSRQTLVRLGLGFWLAAAGLAPGVAAASAFSIFLLHDGVSGETTDPDHLRWIEVNSVTWGFKGVVGTVKSSADSMTLIIKTGTASPALALLALNGKPAKQAILDIMEPSGGGMVVKTRIVLGDVVVRAITSANTGVAGPGFDQVSLGFSRFDWSQFQKQPDGKMLLTARVRWDLITNATF